MKIFNPQNTKEKRKNLRKNHTDAEKKLWLALRNRQFLGLKFYRQYGVNGYIADFYCPEKRMAIEVDGGQHYTEEGKSYDNERELLFQTLKIQTMRFSNMDVLKNINGVLEKMQEGLGGEHSGQHFSPLCLKRGVRGV